jgi:Na+/proline symporter
MQSKDTYILAAVGAVTILGFVVAAVAFGCYLLLGGVGALLTSGMALSVVAGALSYGEYRLKHGDA